MSIETQKKNILLELHTEFSKLPVLFRERVCEECNYSAPTFYRKMRGNEGKGVPALSKAEMKRIRSIGEELVNGLFSAVAGSNQK
ncbi:hypothetical protein AB6805_16680 [Chitinophaga sp. RCC_12]|uniref:hypothetical protein n=1 Tax=Chitinophaga sp. RCC_12 TaxID=3239226 RepID=UPI003525EB3D